MRTNVFKKLRARLLPRWRKKHVRNWFHISASYWRHWSMHSANIRWVKHFIVMCYVFKFLLFFLHSGVHRFTAFSYRSCCLLSLIFSYFCKFTWCRSLYSPVFSHSWRYTDSGQLNLLPFVGQEMNSSLRATGWRLSVAGWSGGMSGSCKPRIQLCA